MVNKIERFVCACGCCILHASKNLKRENLREKFRRRNRNDKKDRKKSTTVDALRKAKRVSSATEIRINRWTVSQEPDVYERLCWMIRIDDSMISCLFRFICRHI